MSRAHHLKVLTDFITAKAREHVSGAMHPLQYDDVDEEIQAAALRAYQQEINSIEAERGQRERRARSGLAGI